MRRCSPADLEAARRDGTVVLDHDDLFERRAPLEPWQHLDAEGQARIAQEVRDRYEELRAQEPAWSDDKVRDAITKDRREWCSYGQTTHRRTFLVLTDRTTTPQALGVLRHMMALQVRVARGELDLDAATEEAATATVRGVFVPARAP